MPLPAGFWTNEIKQMLLQLLPQLTQSAQLGIKQAGLQVPKLNLKLDTTKANEVAAAWAQQHADTLLQMLQSTTQEGVGQVISDWLTTPGASVGDLNSALAEILDGDVARATRIGVTETTRAVAQGNILAYAQVGAEPPPMWSDKTGERPFGPPAHPNCRCGLQMVAKGGQYLIVWQTMEDEEVCTEDIETPWGYVAGCKDLDDTVISDGPYGGKKLD
jgi:hypothetical protein